MVYWQLFITAAVLIAQPTTQPAPSPAIEVARTQVAADPCFKCTQVIGYSQVGSPRAGGWYVMDGVFESIVPDDKWQLLWNGGAGVDKWRDPDYRGWSSRLISPCPTGADKPDRVVLSISGPYGDNETAWAEAIEATVDNIRKKLPTTQQIVLQPVVGGRDGKACPGPGGAGGRVRASWQHNHIANAIKAVAAKHEKAEDKSVRIVAGYFPQVRTCADYADGLGHLTREGAVAAGRTIGEHYLLQDAHCAASGHRACGRNSTPARK